jgi:hypothetical protein
LAAAVQHGIENRAILEKLAQIYRGFKRVKFKCNAMRMGLDRVHG